MLIRKPADISSAEITSESVYLNRRQLLAASGATIGLTALSPSLLASSTPPPPVWMQRKISAKLGASIKLSNNDPLTPLSDASSYNNFYEFGFTKEDPKKNSAAFRTDPWSIEISGQVKHPGRIQLEDLISPYQLEERIYRFRCVEAWSMVVPWLGFSLADLLKKVEPTSDAKYVYFETLTDPEQFPEQASALSSFPWPYREGLRLDEAMNPLSFLTVGLYGKALPNQNGAPIRLIVPWKYGFKSIKSIVKIHLTSTMPTTTWNTLQPQEYGFYANVNPEVDHPRWSQAAERRLPSSLFNPNRIPTLKFNGYEKEVAHLYKDMDLSKYI